MGRRHADTLDEGVAEGFHRTVAHFRRHFAQRPVRMEQDVADGHPTVGFEPFVCSHPGQYPQAAGQIDSRDAQFFCIENRIMIHIMMNHRGEKVQKFVARSFMENDTRLYALQRSASVASRPQKEIKISLGVYRGYFVSIFVYIRLFIAYTRPADSFKG